MGKVGFHTHITLMCITWRPSREVIIILGQLK